MGEREKKRGHGEREKEREGMAREGGQGVKWTMVSSVSATLHIVV